MRIEPEDNSPSATRDSQLDSGEKTATQPGKSAALASSSPRSAHSREEAEVEDIVRVLRGYGVLTRARLLDICGAAHWSDSGGRRALAHAVSSGRVRQLGDDLYEIAEPSK
jgi:hypothetical protein